MEALRGTQLYEMPSPMVMAAATTLVVFGPVFALFGLLMFGGWVSDEGRGGGGCSIVVHSPLILLLNVVTSRHRHRCLRGVGSSLRWLIWLKETRRWTPRQRLVAEGHDRTLKHSIFMWRGLHIQRSAIVVSYRACLLLALMTCPPWMAHGRAGAAKGLSGESLATLLCSPILVRTASTLACVPPQLPVLFASPIVMIES